MKKFNEYMEEFKKYSLEGKRNIALEQLKIIASLTNKMCEGINAKNEVIVTKNLLEAYETTATEEDFIEGIVVYTNSIQNSLCDFIDKMTTILYDKSREE